MPVEEIIEEPPLHMQQAKWIWESNGFGHLDVILPERYAYPEIHVRGRVYPETGLWKVSVDRKVIASGKISNPNWQKEANRAITESTKYV